MAKRNFDSPAVMYEGERRINQLKIEKRSWIDRSWYDTIWRSGWRCFLSSSLLSSLSVHRERERMCSAVHLPVKGGHVIHRATRNERQQRALFTASRSLLLLFPSLVTITSTSVAPGGNGVDISEMRSVASCCSRIPSSPSSWNVVCTHTHRVRERKSKCVCAIIGYFLMMMAQSLLKMSSISSYDGTKMDAPCLRLYSQPHFASNNRSNYYYYFFQVEFEWVAVVVMHYQ